MKSPETEVGSSLPPIKEKVARKFILKNWMNLKNLHHSISLKNKAFTNFSKVILFRKDGSGDRHKTVTDEQKGILMP